MNLKTGYPYWLIKNGLPHQYPKLMRNIKTEVVIIGGGISGALSAYYLTQKGISCVLLDKRTVGLGSTCASTSLIQYELDLPLVKLADKIGEKQADTAYVTCAEATKKIIALTKTLKFEDVETIPSLYYAGHKKDKKMLEQEWKARQKLGIQVDLLDEKQIQQSYGFNASTALMSELGCSVDVYKLSHALCRASLKKGLTIYDRSPVTKIREGKSSVTVYTENGSHITCKKVINASGYEVNDFTDLRMVKLVSTYALASENLDDTKSLWKDRALIWNTNDPYLYMRLTTDDRIIIGGRDEQVFQPSARDKLIKKKTTQLTADFKKIFPEINFVPEFSWAGTFGVTKDSLPYIGAIKQHPNMYYALGFGGNGITFSLIAADMISDMILGKTPQNKALFSFDRLR